MQGQESAHSPQPGVAHVCTQQDHPREIHAVAFEVEPVLLAYSETTMDLCRCACEHVGVKFTSEIHSTDFIRVGAESLSADLFRPGSQTQYDAVIMNPPYRKLGVGSQERARLDAIGVGSTNLYTAFLSIAVRLLALGGEHS